ncbi:hypothetical protein H257_09309 [Aphanomyces astaci]|uniref:HTH CENPB-type domain-containing protein n=1 Tax=Aphanomyces astaci TaxID=112090 RepID=W4GC55_APHAT|nr:hypothetical protein H257_09309 [Aphanomyces astaci]ETV76871.1 hypothetical protein H257_09309 [Aphanomyces astaci]|eukprot:XP_009833783.1 hypothetical protein H257_09309 [Aphanomyces astaci]
MIKRKGQLLARELNVDDSVRFSNGWLHRFQQRNTLKMYRMHGEAAWGGKLLQSTSKLYHREEEDGGLQEGQESSLCCLSGEC